VQAERVLDVGDAQAWAEDHRAALRAALPVHGAVLIRGLGLRDAAGVAAVVRRLTEQLMPEREGFGSRTEYPGPVYSSTTWTPDTPMCMHHELAYARTFPATVALGCLTVADSGGEVELADSRAILAALPEPLVRSFDQRGWQLRRSYHALAGISWQEAFGTGEQARVDEFARAQNIETRWLPGGALRTVQRRPAVLRHPLTGERCWFNNIAFLSRWTLDPEIRDYLEMEFGVEGIPLDTAFGDGAPLDATIVEAINEAYTRHTVRVNWAPGDLLLIDNVATAHSRRPYRGDREVIEALGGPVDRAALDPSWPA